MLGGSIGIAASTAVLGRHEKTLLLDPGLLSPDQLASLESAAGSLAPAQHDAVVRTYADAFADDMHVCAAVAGACVLVALAAWRGNPPSMAERRREQAAEEVERRRAAAAVGEGER